MSSSTSGNAQFLGDRLVRWSSKKQKSIAISTTEAEYIALSGSNDQIFEVNVELLREPPSEKEILSFINKLGTKPVKSRRKGLLTKQRVEVVVRRILKKLKKKKRTIDQKKTNWCEGSSVTLEVPDGLSHKGPNEGSGVILEVPDEPRDSSSSSSLESDDDIKEISSDDERSEADDTKKADAEKAKTDKDEEEKNGEEQNANNHSSQTLSSAEYGNQFIIDNPDLLINDVLKEPIKAEEKKKRKQKDSEALQKDKDQAGSLKKVKSPSKSSKIDKYVHAEETVHYVEIEAGEFVKEDVVDAKDPS
ncbi:hypothetical protein Tco_0786107 [Tanacetum coccineum]